MRIAPPIAAVLLATSLAACGSSSDNGETTGTAATPGTTTAAEPPAPSRAVTIRMSEFAFTPKDATARAGKVTITAPNDGKVEHELVVLRTNADPAKLPMKGDEVDESTSVGEIADVKPGATKKTTLRLKPGKYVMVCALPGHYEGGMYGTLKFG